MTKTAITDHDVAAANQDGAYNVPSLRTLGTGPTQASPGNAVRWNYHPLATYIQAVPDGTTASAAVARQHCAAMTALPASGVLAVEVDVIILGGTAANPANVISVFDYSRTDGEASVQLHAGPGLVNPYFHSHRGMVMTGGTNNQQIDYTVGWGSNYLYYIRVSGYWTAI